MNWVRRGLAGFAVALLVAGGGGYLWLRTSLPRVSGEILVNGPGAPVEIVRDRNAVPHIRAASEADAYYALGFVHAQDRLFQMDFQRRIGLGRVSEVVGRGTLRLDVMMRVLGLYRLAEASLDRLSPEARAALEAYAAGVNAFIETHEGALPPEFLALRYTPEPWQPWHSLLWARMMALRLAGNWRTEALRAGLASRLPPERIEQLFPEDDDLAAPTVSAAIAHPFSFAALIGAWPEEMAPITASNSWAVAGSRTASGKPVLANDPHLGFRAPGLWYLARIAAPGLTLTGATVPGVPFHILGHNGHIAWAFTTTGSDTQDLFIERIDPNDRGRYLTPEGARPFQHRSEIIRVRGVEDVSITVRHTRHGPVLSDMENGLSGLAGDGSVIALAAAALRDDDMTAEAIFRLNRARGWQDFRDAMRLFHAPQQNVTYADTDGNIGFTAPGRVPIRRTGDGRVPVPGWSGDYDWTGFIPFEALPAAFNPSAGRIVNANHRVVPPNYPYRLGSSGTPGYRAQRIHMMLDAAVMPHSAATSAAMQTDIVSLMARQLAPLMTRIAPRSDRARQALAMVRAWDGTMDAERPEPLIFIAWLRAFNDRLYRDELGSAFGSFWDLHPVLVRRALTSAQEWCDRTETEDTETCDSQLELALDAALAELAATYGGDPTSWKWGDAHYARFRHPLFGRIPVARRLADITGPTGGGAYTVNRAQHRLRNSREPFASVHGPGLRAVYDLADLDRSLFAQATGQSGNPLSPRYRDGFARWRDGGYIRIPASRDRALEGAVGMLLLVPRS